jgi:D-alanyl-lipoteichoic acid acyltransferase DltB (MBOAT superfamily)
MTLLRVISYCLDRHWQFRGLYKFDSARHRVKCESCSSGCVCYKARSEQHLERPHYESISNYFAYLTYVPLFITGP